MLALLIYNGIDLNSIVTMVSVIAVVSICLISFANRISRAMASMAYLEPTLDKVIENLIELAEIDEEGKSQIHSTDIQKQGMVSFLNNRSKGC